MQEIEKALGYVFKDKKLLKTALTHSSYANEHRGESLPYNERLEFLGDSVLSMMISVYLFENFDHVQEGELTRIRAAVVCEQTLFNLAKKLDIGSHLSLGRGEEQSHGRERPSILADAFEAVMAGVYLDGGMEEVRRVFLPLFRDAVHRAAVGKLNRDYKTALQEIVQQNREETLEYAVVTETGPDHNKSFEVELRLNSNVIGKGSGKSKKEAEQMAAREALRLMGEE